ncbi:FAD-dependent oxidoreductase [Curtobacterium sp. Leaf261]|uniref:FAD-dependent oxidoreductase n=1 Tax=Curtobacterium sp. Leaf261 TaxID=1736311 RepID=UPI0006FFF3CC|nr:NAD(P)/FAD-dependent oxidoreductase [Curtobacterium sp. Leaf261]KQO64866.1 hypothetical protein ASF23_01400 [Curtobacterium sp. Leaf261]
MPVKSVDVLVVGGGAVGLLVGAMLAQDGLDVLVVERRGHPPTRSRAIGMHPPGLDALALVDAAEPVLRTAVRVARGVATSRGRTLGTLSFAAASPRWPFVAALEQHRTEAVLRARLLAIAPGALRVGRTVSGIAQRGDRVVVTTTPTTTTPSPSTTGDPVVDEVEGVEVVEARFVVAADGARSAIRTMLGVPADGRTYPDTYLMGDFHDPTPTPTGADRAAVVDVGAAGVVESFPLPDGVRRFVAWTPDLVSDSAPATTLAGIVAHRTGVEPDPTTATMTSAFRVHRRIVRRSVTDRVVLVGDAAHEISPIGGQGMNLGWLDAVALVPLLIAAVRTGGTVPVRELAAFQGRQLRRARVAARQAEWNMALGRPTSARLLPAREALLRVVLAPPGGRLLANVYAMRFV